MQIHAGWLVISAVSSFAGIGMSLIGQVGACLPSTPALHLALIPLGMLIAGLTAPAALAIGAAIGMPRSRS